MISRVFRASVPQELHGAFEEKFRSVSVPLVAAQAGLVDVTIGRPTACNPDAFVMISTWEDEAAIRAFAGEHWNEPRIPKGMEMFIARCSVDHYEQIPR